jgi:hypothetical protein
MINEQHIKAIASRTKVIAANRPAEPSPALQKLLKEKLAQLKELETALTSMAENPKTSEEDGGLISLILPSVRNAKHATVDILDKADMNFLRKAYQS